MALTKTPISALAGAQPMARTQEQRSGKVNHRIKLRTLGNGERHTGATSGKHTDKVSRARVPATGVRPTGAMSGKPSDLEWQAKATATGAQHTDATLDRHSDREWQARVTATGGQHTGVTSDKHSDRESLMTAVVMSTTTDSGDKSYGSDVEQTYVPGNPNTGYVDNSGQWRQDYGSDVGQTYVPGNPNTGYVDNSGQWRQDYGSDAGQTFVPGAVNDPNIEPWRYYYDDTLRTSQSYNGSYQPELAQYADQYAQLDNYRQTDRYADPSMQFDQYDRAAYERSRQHIEYDRYGRPINYGDDYSYNFDPRQQQYLQQMMLRQILGMINNHGGQVNVYRNPGYSQGFDRGYQGGHHHRHSHNQHNSGSRIQLRLNL